MALSEITASLRFSCWAKEASACSRKSAPVGPRSSAWISENVRQGYASIVEWTSSVPTVVVWLSRALSRLCALHRPPGGIRPSPIPFHVHVDELVTPVGVDPGWSPGRSAGPFRRSGPCRPG